jgi:integrase
MKLTQTAVAKLTLPHGKSDAIIFDDELPRFGVRLREGGSRKYVVQYRLAGVERRLTIGPTATLTLEEARRRARKLLVAVDDGRDPQTEKETKRAEAGLIFSSVVDDYLKVRARDMRQGSLSETTRHLTAVWRPLHKLPIGGVSRAIVASHLRRISEESGPVAANRARSALSAFFGWAIGEGLCEVNPVMGTNVQKENPRDRVLTDGELAAIWKAAADNDYGRIIRLLMLTGQRRDEIGALRRSEVRDNEKMICLPAERAKNGREHLVPLSDAAASILGDCIRHGDHVFGRRQTGFGGWSKGKLALDESCGVRDWVVHDIRRTVATRMADIGVSPHIVEAVLNHVSGHKAGVAGVYNRSVYANEKRAALDAWANHLRVIIAQAEGANVVKLQKTTA